MELTMLLMFQMDFIRDAANDILSTGYKANVDKYDKYRMDIGNFNHYRSKRRVVSIKTPILLINKLADAIAAKLL